MSFTRRTALFATLSAVLSPAYASGGPRRIVSLNPCLDAVLLHLVERERIAAVSHYARDPHQSTIAEIAATMNFTYESAEEIIALEPDLVLASRHTALATRAALTRLRIPFALFVVPESIDESLADIAQIGRLTARDHEAAALIADIEGALADAAPAPGETPVQALIFQPRGFAAGQGTLLDAVMTRCGFDNVAARYGVRKWGNVPLELLLADPPQILLSGAVSDGAPSWAERVVRHPALDAIADRVVRAPFPEALMYCGGPVLLKTAAALKAARLRFRERRA